jgi:hypothetical protein
LILIYSLYRKKVLQKFPLENMDCNVFQPGYVD